MTKPTPGQALLLLVILAAGAGVVVLLKQGNLLFTALPPVMALAALWLPWRLALLGGALAAVAVLARTVAVAFGLEPLAFGEWLRVLASVAGWGLVLALVSASRRRSWWLAVPVVLLATPVFVAGAVPLIRSLDTVQRTSHYMDMRDGVKIALDLYLPRGFSDQKVPALLQQTRYFRRTVMHWPYSLLLGGGIRADIRRYVGNGYAYVHVDARGSGASFGSRTQEWSDDEIRDGAEIVEWIVKQPWSSGKVGATGISYDGTAAEMLLANHHPAVKAVAPRFSLLDAYDDIALPGGIHYTWFTENWGSYNDALDRNALTEKLQGFQRRIVKGVAPVAGHEDLLPQAVSEHRSNYDVHAFISSLVYRDDLDPQGLSTSHVSPYAKPAIAQAGVPIYSYSGWYDGAYHRGAISRFLSYNIPGSRLILGPWDHGGRQNVSPHDPPGTPMFDQTGELMRFFDLHLKGVDDGIGKQKPVRYYTMGEEKWKEADTWPVPGAQVRTLYLSPERALGETMPAGAQPQDEYKVDLTATSGTGSRWRSYFNTTGAKIGYPDRAEADKKLLVYNSAPLDRDWEITGSPAIVLWVASSAEDGQFFAYLEDVASDGKVVYITEGLIRGLHRAVNPAPYWQPAPTHSYRREHGRPLQPGVPAEISFALLPTSYLVRKGHALRVALAGADIDQFAPLPGEAPIWRVYRDAQHASRIGVPVVSGSAVEAAANHQSPLPRNRGRGLGRGG